MDQSPLSFPLSSTSSPSAGLIGSYSNIDLKMLQETQTFEPTLNLPAFISFLLIASIYSLLLLRVQAIRDAVHRRDQALQLVRKFKAAQLDGNTTVLSVRSANDSGTSSHDTNQHDQLASALRTYEQALQEELQLRTILPGIKIIPPNTQANEDTIAAAKQFLNWDITVETKVAATNQQQLEEQQQQQGSQIQQGNSHDENGKDNTTRSSLLLQSRRRFDQNRTNQKSIPSQNIDSTRNRLSQSSKVILLVIAFVQILLLLLFSLDSQTANEMFTTLNEWMIGME